MFIVGVLFLIIITLVHASAQKELSQKLRTNTLAKKSGAEQSPPLAADATLKRRLGGVTDQSKVTLAKKISAEEVKAKGEGEIRTATGGLIYTLMVTLTVVAFLSNGAFLVYVFWLSK